MKNYEPELMEIKDISMPELLEEENFDRQMKEIVEPYLGAIRESGYTGNGASESDNAEGKHDESRYGDGVPRLYYELYPQTPNKGTIVICHGFTEYSEKYQELIYYFLKKGYQAAVYDQRGHGRSMREADDYGVVHIGDFNDYVRDLHLFLHEIVMKKMRTEQGKLYLYSHSMGGCVAARYLEIYPDDFDKAVLNAPMLGINLGNNTLSDAEALCRQMIQDGRGTDRIFFQKPFNPNEAFEDCSASSEARFHYYLGIRRSQPEYQTGGASYYWVRESIRAGQLAVSETEVKKIRTPLMLFIAGQETLVDPKAQIEFLRQLPDARGILVKESRHEIFRATNPVLKNYLHMIETFLDGTVYNN